jgi:hypothetical protein
MVFGCIVLKAGSDQIFPRELGEGAHFEAIQPDFIML